MEEPVVTPALDVPINRQPSLARFPLWLLLAVLVSVGIAWLSLTIQSRGLAPLILTSLVVGGSLAGLLILLTRLTGTGSRKLILTSSLVLALVTAGLQHVFAYQAYLANFHQSVTSNPKAAMAKTFNPDFGPAGFWGYMQAEGRQHGFWFMWIVDAVLIVLATAVVVWFGLRRPFCAKCHRWYHVGRVGHLSTSTKVADMCAKLGMVLPTELPEYLGLIRFRVLECRCGCSPARLELSWSPGMGKPGHASAMLDTAGRALFDAFTKPTPNSP